MSITFDLLLMIIAVEIVFFIVGLRYPILAMGAGIAWIVQFLYIVANNEAIIRIHDCGISAGACVGAVSYTETVFQWSLVSGSTEGGMYIFFFFGLGILMLGAGAGIVKSSYR